jgi:hypothetical protein
MVSTVVRPSSRRLLQHFFPLFPSTYVCAVVSTMAYASVAIGYAVSTQKKYQRSVDRFIGWCNLNGIQPRLYTCLNGNSKVMHHVLSGVRTHLPLSRLIV